MTRNACNATKERNEPNNSNAFSAGNFSQWVQYYISERCFPMTRNAVLGNFLSGMVMPFDACFACVVGKGLLTYVVSAAIVETSPNESEKRKMDPNAALEQLHWALVGKCYGEAREAFNAIKEWMSKGGFAPDWTKRPLAWAYCAKRAREQAVKAFHPMTLGVVYCGKVKAGQSGVVKVNFNAPKWHYGRTTFTIPVKDVVEAIVIF